ncbi:MAG: hypothetical protein ACOY0T_35635 [Myxococcota bacterium]
MQQPTPAPLTNHRTAEANWPNLDTATRDGWIRCCPTPWSPELAERTWAELPARAQQELEKAWASQYENGSVWCQ